jgi:hypothetical protein
MKKKNKFKKNIHERIFAKILHIYLIMKIAWKYFLSKLFMKNTSYFVITVIWYYTGCFLNASTKKTGNR